MTSHISISRLGTLIITSALCLLVRTSHAGLVEGFESGFGAGESVSGDAGIQGTYFGIAPTEGTHQLLLTTINSTPGSPDANQGYHNQSGNNAVSAATLATFFTNAGAGTVTTANMKDGSTTGKEGSGFTINLGTLTAGTTISFDYNFLTQEPPPAQGGNKDFAFYTLTNQTGTTVVTDTLSATGNTPSSPPGNPFGNDTGYLTLSIPINATGAYTLGIGVVDAGSTSTDDAPSALLVDNIQTAAVPEPSTIALGVIGAGLVGLLRARRRA